jgi:aryl-alcohol dehydrogenase-like predicted oxidoreductase
MQIAGDGHHFRAIQLPISLVRAEPVALLMERGIGALAIARDLGIEVIASSPLHGGHIPRLLESEFVEMLGVGLTAAQASLRFVLSVPFVNHVLLSTRSKEHLVEALAVERLPPLSEEELLRILNLIR